MRFLAGLVALCAGLVLCPPMAEGVSVDDNDNSARNGGQGGSQGPDWWRDHPDWGEMYCTDPANPEQPVPTSHWTVRRGYWLTVDAEVGGGERGPAIDPTSEIVTHQMMDHGCLDETGARVKVQNFWMPIVDADTIAYFHDLYAKVERQLPDPVMEWKNPDLDYDWLWVRVEHFAGIEAVDEVSAEASAGDDVTGRAHAWVKATPSKFTLEIPGAEDTEGLAECDLDLVTSEEGCRIRFVHASAIDPSGAFSGTMTLHWDVSSNSGKYDGLEITTEGEFSTVVAEAMAVSCEGDDCGR